MLCLWQKADSGTSPKDLVVSEPFVMRLSGAGRRGWVSQSSGKIHTKMAVRRSPNKGLQIRETLLSAPRFPPRMRDWCLMKFCSLVVKISIIINLFSSDPSYEKIFRVTKQSWKVQFVFSIFHFFKDGHLPHQALILWFGPSQSLFLSFGVRTFRLCLYDIWPEGALGWSPSGPSLFIKHFFLFYFLWECTVNDDNLSLPVEFKTKAIGTKATIIKTKAKN